MLALMATGVHGVAALIHAEGVRSGKLRAELAGAVALCHTQGIVYNAKLGQWADVGMHVAGIVAAFSANRSAHAAVGLYDAIAAVEHGREC